MSTYLNNAATTWPKPSAVAAAVADFLTLRGGNLGRGTSSERDLASMNTVLDCRMRLAELFDGYDGRNPRYATFCSGVTEALNVVLKGYLRPGMRVLSTSMEHNAVVRPLRGLEKKGILVEFLQCESDGALPPSVLRKALCENSKNNGRARSLVVLSHAGNVCGTVQPLEEIAALCREFSVPLVVDAAQTAGSLPISASRLGLAALCFTGHKGLMGPQGVGGIVWEPEFASRVAPLIEGGTGSYSHVEEQPSDMPDKFEGGTPNLPGIAGLNAALSWLADIGIRNIEIRERELGERFLAGLRKFKGVVLYGKQSMEGRLPVFAVNFVNGGGFVDNGILAGELSELGFETRPGLHCAPLAHRTLGTFPQGSLRISPGYFNEPEDIDAFWEAVKKCICTDIT